MSGHARTAHQVGRGDPSDEKQWILERLRREERLPDPHIAYRRLRLNTPMETGHSILFRCHTHPSFGVRMRRTDVRPIFSRRAISAFAMPARCNVCSSLQSCSCWSSEPFAIFSGVSQSRTGSLPGIFSSSAENIATHPLDQLAWSGPVPQSEKLSGQQMLELLQIRFTERPQRSTSAVWSIRTVSFRRAVQQCSHFVPTGASYWEHRKS